MIRTSSSSGLNALNEITNIINPIIHSPTGKLIVNKQYYPNFMKHPYVNESNLESIKNQKNTETDSNPSNLEHIMTYSDEIVEWNQVEPELQFLRKSRSGLVFKKIHRI